MSMSKVRLPLSISTSSRDGQIATGFDASRTLTLKEERIITKAMIRLPRFLSACLRLAKDREANAAILKEAKGRIGGKWT